MSLDLIPSVIPGSDGSGRILAIGSSVASTRPDLKPGVDGKLSFVLFNWFLFFLLQLLYSPT